MGGMGIENNEFWDFPNLFSSPLIKQYQANPFIKQIKVQKTQPKETASYNAVTFSGSIPAQDIDKIRETIQSGCEQVDFDEW